MTDRSTSHAAREIDARRGELAKQVGWRVFHDAPALAERYGPDGQQKCLTDSERHLEFLANALSQENPAFFADYVRWAKVLLGRLKVPPDDLAVNLAVLRDVLRTELSEGSGATAAEYVSRTLEDLFDYPDTLPSVLAGDDPLTKMARDYLGDLLRGDRASAAGRIHAAVESGVDLKDIYLRVFQPSQYEVGRLWQLNEISVAQEHFVTAATQMIMSQLYSRLFASERRDRRLMAAAVGGNLHEIGIRMVSDLFELDGWDTHYLGANTPNATLLEALEAQQPQVLALSVTLTTHISEAEDMIATARDFRGPGEMLILVGGYPFSTDPELWERIGADANPGSADEAIALANRFVDGARG